MLTQVNHWMEFATAAVDAILLLRMLGLRLQRTYLYIVLFCVISVFIDVTDLAMTEGSGEWKRMILYSQLLMAVVYPLAVWDVFEEMIPALDVVRRLAMSRTVTSLIMISVFGCVIGLMNDKADDTNELGFLASLAQVIWLGSAASAATYLWAVYRVVKHQKLAMPHNTWVWFWFFELVLIGLIATVFLVFARLAVAQPPESMTGQIIDLIQSVYLNAVTLWCAVKLKGLQTGVPSTPLNENS